MLQKPVRLSRRRLVREIVASLPEAHGRPIVLAFQPNLHSHLGEVVSKTAGVEIHAACDLRRRTLIMDSALKSDPAEFKRILIHEIFHFAWGRLGNPARASFTRLIETERERGARGELGWSAQRIKETLGEAPSTVSRKYREYICESFCDTGAWFYSGQPEHPEATLAQRYSSARARWFAEYFRHRKLSI